MMSEDAASYERALLAHLGLTEAEIPWARWARAYERLTTALTEDREHVLGGVASGALGDADTRSVAALIFGARSFVIACALLEAYPPPPGPVVELGAGCGPFGLVAAMRGHRVELRDIAEEAMSLAPGLFRAAGLSEPARSVGGAETLPGTGFTAIALAYSLNEMLARAPLEPAAANGWINRWLRQLAPDGMLYIIEPGTKMQSRGLQTIRDQWRAHVVAPCPQVHLACPLLAHDRDWCHFTWAHAPGPVTQRLAQMTQRTASELHFSWLILRPDPQTRADETRPHRLLELRRPDKHKLSAMLCSPQGDVIRLTAQKRDHDAHDALAELRPGSLLSVDLEALESKGDGLRLREPRHLRLLNPL